MAFLRKRGKSWELHWRENGQQVCETLGPVSRRDAERAKANKTLELKAGRISLIGAGPALRYFAREYLDWHEHEFPDSHDRIRQIFGGHLIPRIGDVPILDLRPKHVESYKHERIGDGAAPATVAKELRTLHAALEKAVEWSVIPAHNIGKIRVPQHVSSRPPQWYTAEELARLYAVSAEYAPIWKLLANTGMRRGEALHLKWSEVDRDAIRLVSTPGARTKSKKWRAIPLSPGAKQAVESLQGKDAVYVIPKIHRVSLSRAFRRCVQASGLSGHLHCLRHTFGAHLASRGVPLRVIQQLMGHSTYAVTERHYAHLTPESKATAVSRLSL